MLLVDRDSIPKETVDEINRLKPKKVYLIGETSSIGNEVLEALNKNFNISYENIIRIGGKDREETSLLIGEKMKELTDIENIYVVNGYRGESDAMSILSKACNEKSPILITNGNKLNDGQIDFLSNIYYPNFYFIGGEHVIKDSLYDEVGNLFDVELSRLRVYGRNNQDTNGEVLDYFYGENVGSLIVTKSDNLIDALCVGAFAGKGDIPVVMATDGLSEVQRSVIKNKSYDTLIEVGGGISSRVINELK